MSLANLLGFKTPESSDKPSLPVKTGPSQGKKQCKNCFEYIGVRSSICKYCNKPIIKPIQQELPVVKEIQYVYEHVRTDTWEKEIANKILSKELDSYWAPTSWRSICYSLEEVLERKGSPYSRDSHLKEDLNRIIIKCIPTNNFKYDENKRIGLLQEMKVVEVC
jgi:hypothetical protein